MLSIAAMSAGQEQYYTTLAQAGYYLEGGEPLGRWWGKGAQALGLGDVVKPEQLKAIFQGYHPDGRPLIQHKALQNRKHQPGWDFTFSIIKSASVTWAMAGEAIRKAIQEEHFNAVKATLGFVEETATWTRRGQNGHRLERAGLIVSTFEHGTSRALDPQLHTHCLVMNVSTRSDGTTGTILSKPFYEMQRTLGALYRAELARGLERRGIAVERVQDWFEIKGVPQELMERFSKRRAAIEKELSARGLESASAAAFATLATREPKTLVPPRAELFRTWQVEGQGYNFTLTRPVAPALTPAQIVSTAAARITKDQSHFTENELLQRMAEAAPGSGLGIADLRHALDEAPKLCPQLIALESGNGPKRYTTREIWAMERAVIAAASRLRHQDRHHVARPIREHAIADHGRLSAEQADAVRHLTRRNRGSLRIIEGVPGSGKTSTLDAARAAWERAGYRVLGATLSGKAARELEKGAGIPTMTLAQFERRISGFTVAQHLAHIAQQHVRAAFDRPTWRLKPLEIDRNTILVVDEAAMVGTRQMAAVMGAVEKGGGMLVLVGDRKQLQPIEAGAPFGYIADHIGSARLDTIKRQQDARDQDAIKQVGEGKSLKVLKDFADRGLLTVADDRAEAVSLLLESWQKGEERGRGLAQILVGTNQEADSLNELCQEKRRAAGFLSEHGVALPKGGQVHAGDRVLVTKRSKLLGIENGDTATIEQVHPRRKMITARLDRGGQVVIPLKDFEHVKLGYAVTTHKGQGSTVDRVYVLAGGKMQDRELSYVQLSRHRFELHVFTDRNEAGDELTRLARAMNRSHEKTLAHQWTPGPQISNQHSQQQGHSR